MPSPQIIAYVDRLLADSKREPGIDAKQDWSVTRQLLLDCIGERAVSPRRIFWQCTCGKVRCTRELAQFPYCLCGSRQVHGCNKDLPTSEIALILRACEAREKAEANTCFAP